MVTLVLSAQATLFAGGFGAGVAAGRAGGFGGFGGGARFSGGSFSRLSGGESFGTRGGYSYSSGGHSFGVSADFSRLPAGDVPKLTGERFGWSSPSAPSSVIQGPLASAARPAPQPGGSPALAMLRPEERPNWNAWSQNRSSQWQQRVEKNFDAWNTWQQSNQARFTDFRNTQEQRWTELQTARSNRQDQSPYRQGLRNYRQDRADQIRSSTRDLYDNKFDDQWWARRAWTAGHGDVRSGHAAGDPWWWWRRCAWGPLCAFVQVIVTTPYYFDYGPEVIDDGDTVYVDDQPVPADEYSGPMIGLGASVEQPPPPLPSADGAPEEWMPLGVFALAPEEKGDPIMFLQLSVNREGFISGAYSSTLTEDQRPIAGKVDKVTQQVAWRIGTDTNTIFVTSLANLTRDVSPVAIHLGKTRSQLWLLVRMPEPASEGQPVNVPNPERTLPPSPTTSESVD